MTNEFIITSYPKLIPCKIFKRINRFSVIVKNSKEDQLAHLTNTGRLFDLVFPENQCLCIPKKPAKTKIRLIGIPVSHTKAVLIDPSEQSKSFVNAVEMGHIPWLKNWRIKRSEVQYDDSRMDFQIESEKGK